MLGSLENVAALITVTAVIEIGPMYGEEEMVGSVPSSVKRMIEFGSVVVSWIC